MGYRFNKIYIDERVQRSKLTEQIIQSLPEVEKRIVSSTDITSIGENTDLDDGKRILLLTKQVGGLVKPCPATASPYLCCQYTIVNQMTQCPMDCSYCILQNYLDRPVVTVHTNVEDVYAEIVRLQCEQPDRFFRFGTGELADSLALDDLTGLAKQTIDFFSGRRNCVIELKTKTGQVQNLPKKSHGNVVISWSVNPPHIIKTEERWAATIDQRLEAASQCQDWGYLLGFHFDPILNYPNWQSNYHDLIQRIFKTVDPSRVAWISLGSLRFPSPLKTTIQQRFPKSTIVYEEMIRGLDGKYRYPKPLRVQLFNQIYGWLREVDPDLFVYFCMESPEVWERVMGGSPTTNAELDFLFAQSLHQRFPEIDMDPPQLSNYPIDK